MDNENAIVVRPENVADSALTEKEMRAQISVVQTVMQKIMVNNVDYGKIAGAGNKPTLLKSGSEKLLSTFRIGVDPIIEDLSSGDEIRYRVLTRGIYVPNGQYLGSGVGEASSNEEKYKWRESLCEAEYDSFPEDRKRVKFRKNKYNGRVQEILQVRTNPADIANTVLKMAKKRSQVDMTLTVTGASFLFTQDVEDLAANGVLTEADPAGKPDVDEPVEKSGSPSPFFINEQEAVGILASMETQTVKRKDGKKADITRYVVANGDESMLVSKFGSKKEGLKLGDKVIFRMVSSSEFRGETVYLAQDIELCK